MKEIVRFEDYSYANPESDRCVLRDIDLAVHAGECHCLGGATGSGKTSLALAMKGLLPPGKIRGRIIHGADGRSGQTPGLGIVLQNPDTQMLTGSVGAEVAFGLENQCVPPADMQGRVKAALEQVGLEKALGLSPQALSMGEKYRLLLAGQLAMAPAMLILDEPATQLDPRGQETLAAVIGRLKNEGIALLLCDNRPGPLLMAAVDHHWHLDTQGCLQPGSGADQRSRRPFRPPSRSRHSVPTVEEVVRVNDMTVYGDDRTAIWSDVSFSVKQGQRVVISGANGSGKTTMLRCLTGFLHPVRGSVSILGSSPDPARLRGRVGCLFQNPERQLFETTVAGEVAFALNRQGRKRGEVDHLVTETMAMCDIGDLAGRPPHLLSFGQKHLVALAAAIASAPRLLLLDDPFAGLDPVRNEQILTLLTRLNEEQGTTLLITSHNASSLGAWPDMTLSIEGGTVVAH